MDQHTFQLRSLKSSAFLQVILAGTMAVAGAAVAAAGTTAAVAGTTAAVAGTVAVAAGTMASIERVKLTAV